MGMLGLGAADVLDVVDEVVCDAATAPKLGAMLEAGCAAPDWEEEGMY